jgi:phage protein D
VNPTARIEINGKDLTTKYGSVLESLTVTDEAGIKSDTCEISIDDRDGFDVPGIGAEIRVWIGYEPTPIYMGRYTVTSLRKSGLPRKCTISAAAADLTSKVRAPKMRSFHETTVRAIVEKIAAAHGLKPIVDAGIGARVIDHIDQQTESDVSFLTRLATRQGASFKIGDGKILFAAKGSKARADGTVKDTIVLQPADVGSWEAEWSKRGDVDGATTQYMDHAAGKRRTARAGSGGLKHRDRRLYGSKAEAEAAAKANLDDRARSQLTVSINGPGDPRLYADGSVTLKGFDAAIDRTYRATRVTHTFSGQGYTTGTDLEGE